VTLSVRNCLSREFVPSLMPRKPLGLCLGCLIIADDSSACFAFSSEEAKNPTSSGSSLSGPIFLRFFGCEACCTLGSNKSENNMFGFSEGVNNCGFSSTPSLKEDSLSALSRTLAMRLNSEQTPNKGPFHQQE
jgi:hypothetical protein